MNATKAIILGAICCFGAIGIVLFLGIKSRTQNLINKSNVSKTLSVGDFAPDFRASDIDGRTFRLGEKKGKTVILFGMAGWCATCIAEGRVLTKIQKEYKNKGVEVIGIAFTQGDNIEILNQFKKVGQINIPIALDTDNIAQKYGLRFLETTYIINKKGQIVYKDEQNTDEEIYKRELEKIL